MLEALSSLAALAASMIYWFVRLRGKPGTLYLPDIFLLSLTVHVVGCFCLYLAYRNPASSFVTQLSACALVSAAIWGALSVLLNKRHPRVDASIRLLPHYAYAAGLGFVISVNVAIVYFLLSNSAIRGMLLASFALEGSGLTEVRKAITASTQGYMSPGLIKVLRDVISPILLASYILGSRNGLKSWMFWGAFVSMVMSIVIGGQRFPVVVLFGLVSVSHLVRIRLRGLKGGSVSAGLLVFFLGSMALSGFAYMTYLLGRVSEEQSALELVASPFIGIFERAVLVVPEEAIATYSYWSRIGPTFGESWWREIQSLTPQRSDSSFSNELHELSGGSREGNTPLFFAADAWFAFGIPGIIFAAIAFFCLFDVIDQRLREFRSPIGLSARLFMAAYIPMMYSPFLVLLNGGIFILPLIATRIVCISLIGRYDRRDRSASECKLASH